MIIPDQLSILPEYPGYRDLVEAMTIGSKLRISVAGIEQHYVLAYDRIDGVVIRYERTPDGNTVPVGGELSIGTVRGPLELELLSA